MDVTARARLDGELPSSSAAARPSVPAGPPAPEPQPVTGDVGTEVEVAAVGTRSARVRATVRFAPSLRLDRPEWHADALTPVRLPAGLVVVTLPDGRRAEASWNPVTDPQLVGLEGFGRA